MGRRRQNRRCLMLSTGFVESRHIPKIGKKGQELKETIKYPYFLKVKGMEYFFMPGLYNEWLDPDTSEFINTVAMATTEANTLMKQVHNTKMRMPSIPPEDLAHEWLLGNPSEQRLTEIARTQIPSKMMEFCTIDPDYRTAYEATPKSYPDLAPFTWYNLREDAARHR